MKRKWNMKRTEMKMKMKMKVKRRTNATRKKGMERKRMSNWKRNWT